MNDSEQRGLIHFLARELKAYSRELMAYQLLAHMLKEAGVQRVEEVLEKARHSPELQARFEKNFADFDGMLPPAPPDHSEMAKEFLEKWKPKGGQPN